MKTKAFYVGMLIVLAVCGNSYASPVNLGFEDFFSGWATGSGSALLGMNYEDTGYAYSTAYPTEGYLFLKLERGSVSLTGTVYQTFTAAKGESIIGTYAFDPEDADDLLTITIVKYGTSHDYLTIKVWGDDGDQPWTKWTWNAPSDGSYTLTYSVTGTGTGLFDTVPIPASLLLLGTGLIGLLGIRRRIPGK